MFSLWLDLRGKPCEQDMDTLLGLYTGVRARLDKAGLPPPAGSAVAGVLHSVADLEEDDGEDGGLSLLSLEKDGSLWLDGTRAGTSVIDQSQFQPAVASPSNQYLALLGGGAKTKPTVPILLDVALSGVRERIVDGKPPYLLVECRDAKGLAALAQAERSDDLSGTLPVGAVLRPEEDLWLDALRMPGSGSTAAAPELVTLADDDEGAPEPPQPPASVKSKSKAGEDGEDGAAAKREGPSRRAKRRARGRSS